MFDLSTHSKRVFLEVPGGPVFLYDDLERESARYASAFAGRGVKAGDRVMVQLEKSPESVFLYWGCIRLGAVYVPLNTAYTQAEVDYFRTDSEPALFVSKPEDLADLGRHASYEFPEPESPPDSLAAILYTSGTTGRSKGAMLTRGNLRSNALTLVDAWKLTESDVLLHALPIFHVHGLFVGLHTVIAAGARLLFLPRFDTEEVLALLPRATVMMGVPTFYTRLLSSPKLGQELVSGMRLFISGSAPLSAETHRQFEARTGHAILERYGMTETGMNTSNPYKGKRIPGSVGPALSGVEIRVREEILEVRGPNVFQGYWRNPEKTKTEFRDDGFFITGDVGRIDEDGYVWILGRGKDLIISGGFNVYPKEIENELEAIAGVSDCAVIGAPHPDFGEGVVAVVVRTLESTLDEAGIVAALSGRLARFKQPKRVFFVDSLPRNAMGKVEKKVLRETYAQTFAK